MNIIDSRQAQFTIGIGAMLQSGELVITDEEKKIIRKVQKKYDELYARVAEMHHDTIKARYETASQQYTDHPTSKNWEELREVEASKTHALERAQELRRTAREALVRFMSSEGAPALAPIADRLASAFADITATHERIEVDAAARFGVPFVASELLMALRQLTAQLAETAKRVHAGDVQNFGSPLSVLSLPQNALDLEGAPTTPA